MRWQSLLVLVAALAAACAKPPTLAGASLLCDTDSNCPNGLRCYKGLCLFNSPPVLQPFAGILTLTANTPLPLVATATDAEGDAITYTWTEAEGPELVLDGGTLTGAILDRTPHALGLYVFSVRADDTYSLADPSRRSLAVEARVLVQPAAAAIYVSDLGSDGARQSDGAECGAFDHPCKSVTQGLTRMRASGATEVLLAATTSATPYDDCVTLGAGESLLGCYTAEGGAWTYSTDLRARCRVRCGEPGGHHLSGNAQASDVALVMADSVRPTAPATRLASVWLEGGAPSVANVDVEAPACGRTCDSVGIASIASAATLVGVEVSGTVAGFEPVASFVGVYLAGGSPVIEGTATAGAVTGRGGVTLNVPAGSASTGILAINAQARIDGMQVRGGLSLALVGIEARGGTLDATSNTVLLTGFGTRSLIGLRALVCSTSSGCDCAAALTDCAVPGPSPATVLVPGVTATDNVVALSAGSNAGGLMPCVGVGVSVEGVGAGALLQRNDVDVGQGFTFAVAFAAAAPVNFAAPAGATPTQLLANTGRVAGAAVDSLCVTYNQRLGLALPSAAIGVSVVDDGGALVRDNTLALGVDAGSSIGVWLSGGDGYTVERNEIVVGEALGPETAEPAFGIWAQSAASAALPSELARNRVALLHGALHTTALELDGDLHWHVVNNFLFGGFGAYGTGLGICFGGSCAAGAANLAWPNVQHNTIVGGGAGGASQVSRAVAMRQLSGAAASPTGKFDNNLLDAGEGIGRRFIIDNSATLPASGTGNIAQRYGPSSGPGPRYVFTNTASTSLALPFSGWWVVMQNSGEETLVGVKRPGATPVMSEGASLALAGRPKSAWAGTQNNTGALVVAMPGGLAVGLTVSGSLSSMSFIDATTYTQGKVQAHDPAAAVAGEFNGVAPGDLAFIERKGSAGEGALYVMYGNQEKGYDAPEKVKGLSFLDPSALSVSTLLITTHTLAVADGTRLLFYPQLVTLDAHEIQRTGTIGKITVAAIEAVSLLLMGDTAVDVGQDLLMQADGRLYVFLNIDATTTLALGMAMSFSTEPCAGAKVTAFATGQVDAISSMQEIVVGCDNGAIELYGYDGFSGFDRLLTGTLPSTGGHPSEAVTHLATAGYASGLYVAALREGVEALEMYDAVPRLGPYALSFNTDVAYRMASGALAPDFTTLASPQITLLGAGSVCALAWRSNADPLDLHLAGASNPCVDSGATLSPPVPADIDAEAVRPAGSKPDVGADEVLP